MKRMESDISPFLFGKTTSESSFINRTKDIERLWLNMRSGINTVLISPRRWGKSSLVEHTARLNNNDTRVRWCFIDMFSVRDEMDFYERLSRELIKATSSKWEDWMRVSKTFFKQVVPKIHIGTEPINDFSISFEWEELVKHKDEILNLPEKIAEKYGIQMIICIDEFQNIHNFADAEHFEKLLRSQWQHHQHVSYCLYGSKRTLMTAIFNKKNRAFYRFGDIMMLDKIATEHWVPFIVAKFKQTGKIISEILAEKIVSLMKNHSYYVQQLSHHVWADTAKEVTPAILQHSTERMLEVNQALYQYEIENLSNTQISLLKAIVNGVEQFTSKQTMQDYRIGTPQNVIKNIKSLENQDFIEKLNKKISLLDPAFELWFRKFYMEKSIDGIFEIC